MKRVHLNVHGVVQGVFFRASTQAKAHDVGVTGWVRNLPDGSVEAEVQGPKAKVDAMVGWCHLGPRHANVDRVDVQDIDPVDGEPDFVVR